MTKDVDDNGVPPHTLPARLWHWNLHVNRFVFDLHGIAKINGIDLHGKSWNCQKRPLLNSILSRLGICQCYGQHLEADWLTGASIGA
jgi:hypothetical protein